MSDQESIAAKLDEAFVELMIRELAGQSRTVPGDDAADSPVDSDASATGPADASFEAMVTGQPDESAELGPPSAPGPIEADEPAPDEEPTSSECALLEEEPARTDERDADAELAATRPPTDATSGQQKVVLEITEPNHRERVFRVHRKPVVIGRGRDSDIVLKDTKVSRQHLRIELVEDRLIATDLNSQNGTTINGRVLHEQEVISGDEIALGQTVVRVRRVRE